MYAYMKFVFFSVRENGNNGLGDEGADGGSASPRILGLEQPLLRLVGLYIIAG